MTLQLMQERLMAPPNATWQDILAQASQNAEVLRQGEVVRNVHTILSTNVSVCQSLGHPFIHQMQHIYMDMLQVYRCATHCCAAGTGNWSGCR